MTQLSPITKQNHAGKFWNRFSSYDFASKYNLVPLAGSEIAQAVSALPMAFVKQQDRFFLAGILSLVPGFNLFVAPNGQWLGSYIPAVLRSYPFQLAKAEGHDDLVLCVDEDSGLVSDDKAGGEPFFDEQGQLSPDLREMVKFLSQVQRNRVLTDQAVSALAEAGVITEWPLKVRRKNQEKRVAGLYRIDAAKLQKLDDNQFLKVRRALPLAYAQIMSMANLRFFITLERAHGQSAVKKSDTIAYISDDDMFAFK